MQVLHLILSVGAWQKGLYSAVPSAEQEELRAGWCLTSFLNPKFLYSESEIKNTRMGISRQFGSKGFPGGSDGQESACNAGDPGLSPG